MSFGDVMRWCLLVLFLVGCSVDSSQDQAFVGASVTGMKVDNAVMLTGHDGRSRAIADFKGKVVALFFGYTHCPDVCPTTMAEMNRAMKLLGSMAKDVQVVFVTLDPERDTVDVLNRYVPYFNPGFIGLRGDAGTTKKLAQDFKVFYARQAIDSKAGYLVDHSAGVYVFDRKGNLRLYLNHGQSAKDIAHDFALLIDEK